MKRHARRLRQGFVGLTLAITAVLWLAGGGHVAAQNEYAGWYGPYDDGCYYWWDGYQFTADADCSAASTSSGYAAGWYDAYGDGCLYWYDGFHYSGDVDCNGDGYSDSVGAGYSPGWYDAYGDGCWHWFDGYQYTGDTDCAGDTAATGYAAGWYDVSGDGCLYWYDGAKYTGDTDCNGDGYTDQSTSGWYGPYANGCSYEWDGFRWTGRYDCPAVIGGSDAVTTEASRGSGDVADVGGILSNNGPIADVGGGGSSACNVNLGATYACYIEGAGHGMTPAERSSCRYYGTQEICFLQP